MKLLTSPICVYCGDPTEHYDHVWPARELTLDLEPRSYEVPSCAKCNLTASAKWFDTFWLKQEHLWKIATKQNRGNPLLLRKIVPHVGHCILLFEGRKNIAQRNAATRTGFCKMCDGSIGSARKKKKNNFCCEECEWLRPQVQYYSIDTHGQPGPLIPRSTAKRGRPSKDKYADLFNDLPSNEFKITDLWRKN